MLQNQKQTSLLQSRYHLIPSKQSLKYNTQGSPSITQSARQIDLGTLSVNSHAQHATYRRFSPYRKQSSINSGGSIQPAALAPERGLARRYVFHRPDWQLPMQSTRQIGLGTLSANSHAQHAAVSAHTESKARSIATDQSNQPPLHPNAVWPEYTCFIGRIGSFQCNRRALAAEALQRRLFLIHQRHDNITGIATV